MKQPDGGHLERNLLFPQPDRRLCSGSPLGGRRREKTTMKIRTLIVAGAVLGASLVASSAASAQSLTTCRLDFALKGWSAVVSSAHGEGVITCDNGQHADVVIEAKGAGVTAGKYELRDGHGRFNQVGDIHEIFGAYASGSAGAGAVKDAEAAVMTKGPVSLSLTGKGSGWELGVAVERFVIRRA